LTYTLTEITTGKAASTGASGRVNVPPGLYRIAVRQRSREWQRTVAIRKSQRLEIPVHPGVLIIERAAQTANENSGATGTVDLYRIDSVGRESLLEQRHLANTPIRLMMGEGQFKVVGRSNGVAVEHRVTLPLGETKTLTLRFDQPTQTRHAVITLEFPFPTITTTGGFIRPDVELLRNGRTIRQLSEGDNTLQLEPGQYQIAIASRPPHRLPLTVNPNNGPFTATVEVTPGWFEVDPGRSGTFVLFDGQGRTIAQFKGERAAHSLPDGAYRLEFSGQDETDAHADFDISQGRLTQIVLQ
jgi:hypothetical protein